MTTHTTTPLLGMACGLITAGLLATLPALGATGAQTSASPDNAATTACSPAWSASTVYTGGEGASESGVNYTAVYWTQGNNPATSSGPTGSGYPWISDGACGSTSTPPASITRIFAPYVDMGTAFGEDIETIQQQAGLKAVTLAFLVGASDGSCSVGWGGYATEPTPQVLPNDTLWDGTSVQSIVTAMQKSKVQVILSFGGSGGADPAYNCAKKKQTAATLQALYQSVINRYKVTMLDFDIEPVSPTVNPETDQASLTLRDKALAGLKAANPGLVISYTLPVTVNGLDATGMTVVNSAKNDGLTLDTVNIMAMDYGKGEDDNGAMGQAAVNAATHTKSNIATAFPNATVGITPMIGENDPSNGYIEYFKMADATTVVTFAQGTGSSYISRIGMWSLNRDSGCAANASAAPTTCSGITQTTNQFSGIFNAVH